MLSNNYPQPPSHGTFTFGPVVIDSNFDSGNCSNASKSSSSSYDIWIGTDHPNNNYRTWFYFSVSGLSKGFTVTFKIKNMQNQSKLLTEGLVPVFREQSSKQWKRIQERVNLAYIEYNEGWIEWPFKHTMTSDEKVFLAFFYPWSNDDNHEFLCGIEKKVKEIPDLYFHRTCIINSVEGRPVQLLTISSNKQKIGKQEKIDDKNLFVHGSKPALFNCQKKGIVIGARVHPGEVPGSHVMTGIIEQLTQNNEQAQILRQNFVFYIFPIFNPDGVSRGHYRVDTNGINLNRCYINPSPKNHPSIYAVRKIIMNLHEENRFFGFLDLHAHAARRGTFIYGNWTNELRKQIDACILPKILSYNSMDFEYEGSNFTEKNMNCKDKGDHMSKEGSGRVAIFKATKNAYCWTLECNYNISRVNNVLESRRCPEASVQRPTQANLDASKIIEYRNPIQKEAKQFFTISTYRKLGKEICQSFLDLINKNPVSRIDNPESYYTSVQYLKLNLGFALLKMAPNRFEPCFKKIYYGIVNTENKQISDRSLKALFLILLENARIQNISAFIKDGDRSGIIIESPKKPKSVQLVKKQKFSSLLERQNSIRQRQSLTNKNETPLKAIEAFRNSQLYRSTGTIDSEESISPQKQVSEDDVTTMISQKLKEYHTQNEIKKTSIRLEQFKIIGITNMINAKPSRPKNNSIKAKGLRFKVEELPSLVKKSSINFTKEEKEKDKPILRKGFSTKGQSLEFF